MAAAAARLLLPRATRTAAVSAFLRSPLDPLSRRFPALAPTALLQRRLPPPTFLSRSLSDAAFDAQALDTHVPATVITGFLGSGKSHGKRIAVIENEFGEADIDSSLVASHSSVAEDIVMVNNGCLCCTV
ncbi:hypothetical protein ACP4OV_026422 [Aristida adscensionis]